LIAVDQIGEHQALVVCVVVELDGHFWKLEQILACGTTELERFWFCCTHSRAFRLSKVQAEALGLFDKLRTGLDKPEQKCQWLNQNRSMFKGANRMLIRLPSLGYVAGDFSALAIL
jgi:hypothetical protein